MVIALRLAREGYGGGDPEKVMQMGADWVVMMAQYEQFRAELERTTFEMNKERA